MASAPSRSRWLYWLLVLPLNPVFGILGMVVATGCLDHTVLPWYAALLSMLLIGGTTLWLQRRLRLPIPPLHCLLGVGGILTGLLFWLNLTYCGKPVTRTVRIVEKHVQAGYMKGRVTEGEVSIIVLIGSQRLELDLTRAEDHRVRRATTCDVGVAPGLLGADVVTAYRLSGE